MDFKGVGFLTSVELIWPIVGCREHRREPSRKIKGGEFLGQLSGH
jgi:hypothetical protein